MMDEHEDTPPERTLADDLVELADFYRDVGRPMLAAMQPATARELERAYNAVRRGAARGQELAAGLRRLARLAQLKQR